MIICLGTTPAVQKTMTFNRVAIDAVNRAQSVQQYASGKSINAARVLHTLRQEVVATGFVGGDTGKFIAADLERVGLRHDFVSVDIDTRMCITVVDRGAGSATELIEESPAVAAEAYDALLRKVRGLIFGAKVIVLSGTLPPGRRKIFMRNVLRRHLRMG